MYWPVKFAKWERLVGLASLLRLHRGESNQLKLACPALVPDGVRNLMPNLTPNQIPNLVPDLVSILATPDHVPKTEPNGDPCTMARNCLCGAVFLKESDAQSFCAPPHVICRSAKPRIFAHARIEKSACLRNCLRASAKHVSLCSVRSTSERKEHKLDATACFVLLAPRSATHSVWRLVG